MKNLVNQKSNLAITGIYIFDKNVTKYSKNLKKSSRGETEIIDLLKKYHKKTSKLFNYKSRNDLDGCWYSR